MQKESKLESTKIDNLSLPISMHMYGTQCGNADRCRNVSDRANLVSTSTNEGEIKTPYYSEKWEQTGYCFSQHFGALILQHNFKCFFLIRKVCEMWE